jgi:hypothetical protein
MPELAGACAVGDEVGRGRLAMGAGRLLARSPAGSRSSAPALLQARSCSFADRKVGDEFGDFFWLGGHEDRRAQLGCQGLATQRPQATIFRGQRTVAKTTVFRGRRE